MKISLVLALLILAPFISKEQTYVPFPDSNAVWQEVLLPYPPGPMPAYWEHVHYTVSGDTSINNKLYKKLLRTDYNPACSQDFTGPYFFGGIRNDSNEKKVYYYELMNSQEWLLYDFTLDVGDTVPMTFNNISYPELYVDSIDSVLIGDQFRKRYFYVEPFMEPIRVIEGIGAESGLLGYMYLFESIYYLRCFHHDDSLLWMNPWVNSCSLETDTCLAISVPEQIKDNNLMTLYPNPASDLIYIQFSSVRFGKTGNIRMEIYNMFGQKFASRIILFGKEVFSFDVSGLSNGIYVVVIKENQKIISRGKFVIAR